MGHSASAADLSFRDGFEAGNVPPGRFRHRDHLRLAYIYLCDLDQEPANGRMRSALLRFLEINNVPPGKYHETLTRSWLVAVGQFMDTTTPASSFDEFLSANKQLLDVELMLSHYTREHLFSDRARQQFVEPDLVPFAG